MTDLEMTKLCAEAMGWSIGLHVDPRLNDGRWWVIETCDDGSHHGFYYNPLVDDSQAMELVKRFDLGLDKVGLEWGVLRSGYDGDVVNKDLNRAIVECVAKMQASK